MSTSFVSAKSWDWLSDNEEEDVYLLLFLWECLDLFDFLLLLRESENADLEEEGVEDDLRLLLFLD